MRRAVAASKRAYRTAGLCVVEVVADQGNARSLRKVYVHQVLQNLGASQFGAARRHLHVVASL